MAVIKISATLVIAGLQLNLQVCHLAELTLELAPTSGNFPKPLCSVGNVRAAWLPSSLLAGVWQCKHDAAFGAGLRADALPWGTCHLGHLPQATGDQTSSFLQAPLSHPRRVLGESPAHHSSDRKQGQKVWCKWCEGTNPTRPTGGSERARPWQMSIQHTLLIFGRSWRTGGGSKMEQVQNHIHPGCQDQGGPEHSPCQISLYSHHDGSPPSQAVIYLPHDATGFSSLCSHWYHKGFVAIEHCSTDRGPECGCKPFLPKEYCKHLCIQVFCTRPAVLRNSSFWLFRQDRV